MGRKPSPPPATDAERRRRLADAIDSVLRAMRPQARLARASPGAATATLLDRRGRPLNPELVLSMDLPGDGFQGHGACRVWEVDLHGRRKAIRLSSDWHEAEAPGGAKEIAYAMLRIAAARPAANQPLEGTREMCEAKPDEATKVCRICDGGPGNSSACLCGLRAWESRGATPPTGAGNKA